MSKDFLHKTDEELMNLYLTLEPQAFEVLYQRHSGKIFGYLRKKVSTELAEELLQDTFIKIHTSKHTYKSEYLFLPWLFTITQNTLRDHFKKANLKVHEHTTPIEENTLITDPQVEDTSESSHLFTALNHEQQRVFELRYLKDWSFEQIAEETQKTPANIRQLISRGLKKLKSKKAGSLS